MANFKITAEGDTYIIMPATRVGGSFVARYRPYLDYPTKAGAEEAALNMDRQIKLCGDQVTFVEANKKTATVAAATVSEQKKIYILSVPQKQIKI